MFSRVCEQSWRDVDANSSVLGIAVPALLPLRSLGRARARRRKVENVLRELNECLAMFSSWPLYSGAGSVGKIFSPQYCVRIHRTNA
jgi:hypothetical protein